MKVTYAAGWDGDRERLYLSSGQAKVLFQMVKKPKPAFGIHMHDDLAYRLGFPVWRLERE